MGHEGGHVTSQQLCTYSAKYDNVEHVCQACVRNGTRSVVKKEESRTLGFVWGVSWTCGTCRSVHSSSAILGSDKETREKLRADYFHVWSGCESAVQTSKHAGNGNAGRMCMEHVMRMASSVASAGTYVCFGVCESDFCFVAVCYVHAYMFAALFWKDSVFCTVQVQCFP